MVFKERPRLRLDYSVVGKRTCRRAMPRRRVRIRKERGALATTIILRLLTRSVKMIKITPGFGIARRWQWRRL